MESDWRTVEPHDCAREESGIGKNMAEVSDTRPCLQKSSEEKAQVHTEIVIATDIQTRLFSITDRLCLYSLAPSKS